MATATEPNRSVKAAVRLSSTVPVPAASSRARRWASRPGDAVPHQLGQEVVEVGEVPVQYALGAARLGG